MNVRWARGAGLVGLIFSIGPSALAARQDTTVVESPPAVSDSVPDDTTLVRIAPTIEPEVPLGPLLPGTRLVLTRDSIQWSGAITLADLLTAVPGVYVARAGFLGQPEYVRYAGRGPEAVEYFRDGYPLMPVGGDSVYFDPADVKLTDLQRVDIEILPSVLRVHLVSERHNTYAPRSFLKVMSGAFSTAQYGAVFSRRWPSGWGMDLHADFTQSDGAQNVNRSDQLLDIAGKVRWMPAPNLGVVYQIRRQTQERELLSGITDGPPLRFGTRTESIFRFFSGGEDDGYGLRFDGGVGTTTWSDSLLDDQHIRLAFARVRAARPGAWIELTGRAGDDRVRRDLAVRGGWMPTPGIVVTAEAGDRLHPGGRTNRYVRGGLGLYRGPFSLVGQVTHRDGVQAPALLTDSAQTTDDASIRLAVSGRRLTGGLALVRRDAFLPLSPPDLPGIAAFDTTRSATFFVADGTFHIAQPLTFRGWYVDPGPQQGFSLQPPRHGRGEVTFRSKFWRQFRSGIFDLKVSYRWEVWGNGVAGLDAGGNPIPLPATNFQEIFLQIQLADFKIFWNLRNSTNTRSEYVPGLPYPVNAQVFGVQWVFFN